jgi:hypothetical protein
MCDERNLWVGHAAGDEGPVLYDLYLTCATPSGSYTIRKGKDVLLHAIRDRDEVDLCVRRCR